MAHTLKIVDQLAALGQKILTKILITRKITYIYPKKFQHTETSTSSIYDCCEGRSEGRIFEPDKYFHIIKNAIIWN